MITELMTYRGYPHWLMFRGGVLSLVATTPVEVGHGFTFGQHFNNIDRKQTIVHRVTEIIEERTAKGKYQKPDVQFFKVKTEQVIEDTTDQELLISH